MACDEKTKARARAYYYANRERILAQQKAKYAADPARAIANAKRWRERNPEEFAQHRRRSQRAKAGILDATGAQFDGPCAVCARNRRLVLDHDHATGIIRGWLCGPCNMAIGLFKDCTETIKAAAAYLEMHKEKHDECNSEADDGEGCSFDSGFSG